MEEKNEMNLLQNQTPTNNTPTPTGQNEAPLAFNGFNGETIPELNNQPASTELPTLNNAYQPPQTVSNQNEPAPIQPSQQPTPPLTNEPMPQNFSLGGDDQIIAQIAPEKEVNPTLVVVLFILLIGFAIALPTVNERVTDYLNSKKTNAPTSGSGGTTGGDEGEDKEVVIADLTSSTVYELDGINVANIYFTKVKNDNHIAFSLVREEVGAQYNPNLYIELYADDMTLLSRSRIYLGNSNLNESTINLSTYVPEISVTSAKKIAVVEKTDADYTPIELTTNIKGDQTLTCTKGHHELTYTFQAYMLRQINEKYTAIKGADLAYYATELNEYQQINMRLASIAGVSSSLITSDTGFTMSNIFDLTKADISSFYNYAYYNSATSAKKINFEMKSMGYTCS